MDISSSPSRIRNALRALVRQLSAAVYALVLFAFVSSLIPPGSWAGLVVEAGIVFIASGIVARFVEGPLGTVGFVGPFVALLDFAIVILSAPEGPGSVMGWSLLFVVVPPVVGGGLGTVFGRRLVARRAANPGSS